jgi:hypothetical protein
MADEGKLDLRDEKVKGVMNEERFFIKLQMQGRF